MDNTPGLGAAMEAAYQRNTAKTLEERIAILENRVRNQDVDIRNLALIVQHLHEAMNNRQA